MRRASRVGIATLLLFGCSSERDSGTQAVVGTTVSTRCDGAGETSTIRAGHIHTLCVPSFDSSSPPATGGAYETSVTNRHRHLAILSEAELVTIANGGEATITTTSVAGHTHDFVVRRGSDAPTLIVLPGMAPPIE